MLKARAFPDGAAQANWLDRGKEWIDARLHRVSSQQLVTWDKEATRILQALAEDPDEKIAGFATDAVRYRLWASPLDYWLSVIRKHQ